MLNVGNNGRQPDYNTIATNPIFKSIIVKKKTTYMAERNSLMSIEFKW